MVLYSYIFVINWSHASKRLFFSTSIVIQLSSAGAELCWYIGLCWDWWHKVIHSALQLANSDYIDCNRRETTLSTVTVAYVLYGSYWMKSESLPHKLGRWITISSRLWIKIIIVERLAVISDLWYWCIYFLCMRYHAWLIKYYLVCFANPTIILISSIWRPQKCCVLSTHLGCLYGPYFSH